MGFGRVVAISVTLLAATALAQDRPIDLRIVWNASVLARRGAHAGGGGAAVRLVGGDGAICDGTLGPNTMLDLGDLDDDDEPDRGLAAAVTGCSMPYPIFAIVNPRPAATWPTPIAAIDPRAADPHVTEAAALARTAAAEVMRGRVASDATWNPPRVFSLRDATYVLVSGPACPDDGIYGECSPVAAALTRVRLDSAPEVLIARPAHWLFTEGGAPIDCAFGWAGVVDVDGDGVVELIEAQIGESVSVIRLVRVGASRAGDVVWLASYRRDPFSAIVGPVPRPVTH
jgi:hypothetical protein